MSGKFAYRTATPQTPRERLSPGNKRIKGPRGRTTWAIKATSPSWGFDITHPRRTP